MILIELTDDKYGHIMKKVSCMEHCLAEIKEIIEEESSSESSEDSNMATSSSSSRYV